MEPGVPDGCRRPHKIGFACSAIVVVTPLGRVRADRLTSAALEAALEFISRPRWRDRIAVHR